jgi:hypothetical protein
MPSTSVKTLNIENLSYHLTQSVSIIRTSQLVLFGQIIPVYSTNHVRFFRAFSQL